MIKTAATVNILLLKFRVTWSIRLIHCSVVLCCDVNESQNYLH
jgi:hypothetical protein